MSEKRAEYEIPLFPISGWDVGHSASKGAVLLRMLYADTPGEQSPHQGLMYAMTPDQARELARELLNQAHEVAND